MPSRAPRQESRALGHHTSYTVIPAPPETFESSGREAAFPPWLRQVWSADAGYGATRDILRELGLNTVCQGAKCPNRCECWQRKTATFMALGAACTRACRYCAVEKTTTPLPPDPSEPDRIAQAVARMGLRHAVVTSVTRDDLPDGGAALFAAIITAIRAVDAEVHIEVLTPDFEGDADAVDTVLNAQPDVFGHNIETVRRLFPRYRDHRADYDRSLGVLRRVAARSQRTAVKSAFMMGLGETDEDVTGALRDLLEAGCAAVAIGQYLRPTSAQIPVAEFITPERFRAVEEEARSLGFRFAVAGPFVRSSYHAAELLQTSAGNGESDPPHTPRIME